jgi:hypothetical protein
VASHPVAIQTQLRPLVSDYTPGGPGVSVDWLRMGPYAPSGTFSSRVLDAGQQVVWGTLDAAQDVPAGTTLALEARTGDTPTPDGSWSAFEPVAVGAGIGSTGRYLQYRASFTSSGDATPVLRDVTASYAPAGQSLFGDDFESGSLSAWTGVKGLVDEQGDAFAGSWAAHATAIGASAAYASKTLSTPASDLYARFRVKLLSQGPKSTVTLLRLRSASGTSLLRITAKRTSHQLGYRNDMTKATRSASAALALGVWHTVLLHVVVGGASGHVDVSLDGTAMASLANVEDLGTAPVGRLELSDATRGHLYEARYDDVLVSTTPITG